jgi:hypothetical protein
MPGGTITLINGPLPSGYRLTILSAVPYAQTTDIPAGGNLDETTIESTFDTLEMQIQQLREEMDRTVKLPPTSSESAEELVDDLQRIADSADNLDTVAGSIGNVNTVAGAIGNVNAVGPAIANVNTVAANVANVNTVAGAIGNVNTVATNVANVNAVGANISKVNTVAANITDVTNYADTYLGPKTSPPTTRNDGSALQVGDLYFNTTSGTLAVYHGSGWTGLNVTAVWGPTRTITIGNTGKSVDGSANVSWSLVEILGFGTDMVNADHAAVLEALMQANTALRAIDALRYGPWQQHGEVTLVNRGVVTGCTVSKSTTAARNLNIEAGAVFANGRTYPVNAATNAASVPPNTGGGAVTVSAYLYPHSSGTYKLAVTAIGQALPDDAIEIYRLTIPAGSTDATDPYLANVTLTSVRRIEGDWPTLMSSPPEAYVTLPRALKSGNYRLHLEPVSWIGPAHHPEVQVASRASNGFTLRIVSPHDAVTVRWGVQKLDD